MVRGPGGDGDDEFAITTGIGDLPCRRAWRRLSSNQPARCGRVRVAGDVRRFRTVG